MKFGNVMFMGENTHVVTRRGRWQRVREDAGKGGNRRQGPGRLSRLLRTKQYSGEAKPGVLYSGTSQAS